MVTFDLRDITRVTKRLERFANQIPFALATALNKSTDVAREELPQVWAQHITARNPNFLKAALSRKGTSATKRNLRVELRDVIGRGNLGLHDKGGSAHGSGALAIPTTTSGISRRRGAKGVPKGMQPRNLTRSFGKAGKSGDTLIYQQVGKYQKATKRKDGHDGRSLKLAYVTKPTNRVRADVPFHAEFDRIMRREMPKQFSTAIKAAMKTALRK